MTEVISHGKWVRGNKITDDSENTFESWMFYCPKCKCEPMELEDGSYMLTDYCPTCGEFLNVTDYMRSTGGAERRVKINYCPLCGKKVED